MHSIFYLGTIFHGGAIHSLLVVCAGLVNKPDVPPTSKSDWTDSSPGSTTPLWRKHRHHCSLFSRESCYGSDKLCVPVLTFSFCSFCFQSSGVFQEEPDVHSGHRHRVRANTDVARAGRRKYGGQHGVPEPDRGVYPHREPANLQPGQEVK